MNVVIKNRENARVFSSMFQNIRLFCEHINLMFSADRLYAQGMDSSHISIFELSIPKTWFDTYEYTSEQSSIVVGVNVALFFKILNTREDTRENHVKYVEETGDRLVEILLNPTESKTVFEEIRLTSSSNESGNMSVVVPIDDLLLFAINEGDKLNLSFSLAHFHNICAFHKVSGTINLKISDNYPLKATYVLELPKYEDDEIAKMAHIVVFLAPRVSDE